MMLHESIARKEIAALTARIKVLYATPDQMIETDEGTHGTPQSFYIYQTIYGGKYATQSFAGSNQTRCDLADTVATDGLMRRTGTMPAIRRELAAAEKQLKKLKAAL